MNQMEGMALVLQEAVDHLLLTPAGPLAHDGTRPLLWPSASPPSRVPSVARPQSGMEAACTWCAHAVPATFTGAGCVRQSGRGSAWGPTGLVKEEAAGLCFHHGVLSNLITYVNICIYYGK